MATPACAAASAGASLTPSPTKSTLRPARSRSRTASTLSSGSRPARTSVMPVASATRAAAAAWSPVSSTGAVPVRAVSAAVAGAASARRRSVRARVPRRTAVAGDADGGLGALRGVGSADVHRTPVDHRRHPAAGSGREVVHGRDVQLPGTGGAHDRAGQRVLTGVLGRGGEGEEGILADAAPGRGAYGGHLGGALGEGAGLVEGGGVNLAEAFHGDRRLDQDAVPPGVGDGGQQGRHLSRGRRRTVRRRS
ncbi:hypothetical protein STENM223S_06461 [Streptomyces tendae]